MPDAGEQMGLYSIGAYDQLNPWLYGGINLYGAATGRRGGFFTGGYTLGVERQLFDNLIFDAGGYVGAGGGGRGVQRRRRRAPPATAAPRPPEKLYGPPPT